MQVVGLSELPHWDWLQAKEFDACSRDTAGFLTERAERVGNDTITTNDMRAWKADWDLDCARVVEVGSSTLVSRLSDELSIRSIVV